MSYLVVTLVTCIEKFFWQTVRSCLRPFLFCFGRTSFLFDLSVSTSIWCAQRSWTARDLTARDLSAVDIFSRSGWRNFRISPTTLELSVSAISVYHLLRYHWACCTFTKTGTWNFHDVMGDHFISNKLHFDLTTRSYSRITKWCNLFGSKVIYILSWNFHVPVSTVQHAHWLHSRRWTSDLLLVGILQLVRLDLQHSSNV